MVSFNSQPRKGADIRNRSSNELRKVSTHSPARGLTLYSNEESDAKSFQLTAPQGG